MVLHPFSPSSLLRLSFEQPVEESIMVEVLLVVHQVRLVYLKEALLKVGLEAVQV